MELFKPVDFDFIHELVAFTVNDIHKQMGTSSITIDTLMTRINPKFGHYLPDDLMKKINSELTSKGWPELWYIRSYIRRPNNTQKIHLDGLDEVIHAAVNIPVSGCTNTKHIWKIGKFDTVLSKCGQHTEIIWLDDNIETVELTINRTHLLRIDVPHYVVSNESEIRWVLTLRFKGNPSYETLSNLISPC